MNKWMNGVAVVLMGSALLVGGCAGTPKGGPSGMKCRYQQGSVETITVTSNSFYKNWVEMPGKPADQVRSRKNHVEMVLKREVEQVNPDGSAILKVTMEKVDSRIEVDFPDKKTEDFYTSTPEKTDSLKDEPMLGGRSYKIKIAPDTTVLEIIGREALMQQLSLSSDSTGMVPGLISEELIKRCHQRQFMQYPVAPGKKRSETVRLPDVMIKAKALEKTFTAGAVETQNGKQTVTVTTTGAPVYTLPQGFPEPEEPKAFGQKLILDNSDMQEFKVEGQSVFDLTAGGVLKDQQSVSCSLVLLGDKLFGGKGKDQPGGGGGGEMFTEIKISETFERLN